MPRLKPELQRARQQHILDAAEQCFARTGFHRTTMQDICREADVSPGALYLYFDNKEALIAGLCERDRAEFADRFSVLANANDFLAALGTLAQQYFAEEPAHKRLMCVEIGIESTRNDRVGQIYRAVDQFVLASFESLFNRLKREGRIAPLLDTATLARVVVTVGDGLFWRRAIDRDFDMKTVLPPILQMIGFVLRPVTAEDASPAIEAPIAIRKSAS